MLRRASLSLPLVLLAIFTLTMAVATTPTLSNNVANASAGSAFTASSSAALPNCPAGNLCEWTGIDFIGDRTYGAPVPSGRCIKIRVSRSAWNRTRTYARYWWNSNCTGQNILLGRGAMVSRFGFAAGSLGGL